MTCLHLYNQTSRSASDSWKWSLFVRKWSFKPHGGPDWSLVAAPQKGALFLAVEQQEGEKEANSTWQDMQEWWHWLSGV